MKLKDYKTALVKGVYNGLVLSLIINILVAVLRYTNCINNIFYFFGFLFTAITTYLLLRNEKIWGFVISCMIGILLFLVIETMLIRTGIINMVLSGASNEISPGSGYAILLMIVFYLIACLLGIIVTFIKILMNAK